MTAVRRPAAAALMAGAAATLVGCLSACGGIADDARLAGARSDGVVTALGSHALRVGQTYHGDGASVTLRDVRRPMRGQVSDQIRTGPHSEWIGLNVKTCVDASARHGIDVGWWTFSGLGTSGARYPGLTWSKQIKPLPANNWPVPQYPTFGQIGPGECQAGWLLLAGKKDKALRSVTYTDTAGTLRAEWKVSEE